MFTTDRSRTGQNNRHRHVCPGNLDRLQPLRHFAEYCAGDRRSACRWGRGYPCRGRGRPQRDRASERRAGAAARPGAHAGATG